MYLTTGDRNLAVLSSAKEADRILVDRQKGNLAGATWQWLSLSFRHRNASRMRASCVSVTPWQMLSLRLLNRTAFERGIMRYRAHGASRFVNISHLETRADELYGIDRVRARGSPQIKTCNIVRCKSQTLN